MKLSWTHEHNPVWDDQKRRVVGAAPAGALDVAHEAGAPLPGDWWRAADEDGSVVGYGWLDATWGGDAEILLAVDPACQRQGAGTFIIGCLEQEAAARGINYVFNTVRSTHPDRDGLHDWLAVRGYRGSTADTTLRKHVVSRADDGPAPRAPVPRRPAADVTDRPPGHEESGGYVDVEDHRF